METEKQKREPISIPIIETKSSKPKRRRIIGSAPMFKTEEFESGSESDSGSVHSKYIHNILRRKAPHDPTFGVYEDDTGGSLKIERSSFKYNDQHVFVDGKKYKPSHNLIKTWPLFKTNKHINEYYSSLIRIELIIVLQARSEQTKP
jgi:hypothetical protein